MHTSHYSRLEKPTIPIATKEDYHVYITSSIYHYAHAINPFRAPEPLPILHAIDFVLKNGFPVAKGLIDYGMAWHGMAWQPPCVT